LSHLKEINQWEFTRGKSTLKEKETNLNENNMYNDAWKQFINVASDQTV